MLLLCIQIFLLLLVSLFLLYVFFEVRSVRKAKPATGVTLATIEAVPASFSDESLPLVSVLLPVYNEKLVVTKLIDAVCALQYPAGKLEILLLDDSTDETCQIVAARIEHYRERGISIRHVRRETRIGYKAGNLNFGLSLAQGDFIAIFDADCLPPPDFLRKVMPCFAEENVGFLQTGVRYVNRNASFLTRFQAIEAEHKEDVTTGLSHDGFMASLTGSSCVWRRNCIDSIGGISAETITEDVDMGYRAQLDAWKYVFLPEVTSLAELPETMGAFRVQRQRWARGLLHNALRHVKGIFAAPMPLLSCLHAISLMFSSVLLASFYILLLLCFPAAFLTESLGLFFHICCTIFLLVAMAWAWCNTTGQGASGGEVAPLWKNIGKAFGYVVMFFPMSLYYFSAAVQVFAGIDDRFHRTPKGNGRKNVSHPPVNSLLLFFEIFSLAYALITLGISLKESNYWVALYSGLAVCGFALTLLLTWDDNRKSAREHLRHVLITGSTGSLGNFLALEYAAPGMHLTLHGRNNDALLRLAEQCQAKGAVVTTKALDLRQREAVRQWVAELCAVDAPDLIIANAGLNANIGSDAAGEAFAEAEALVEVNLLSTIALIDGAVSAMRKRRCGQIAIVSSLAAYYGLPATPTYCATKAALRNYGMSLRGWLQSEGIRVNVILPGYISSSMCDAMPGPKPFLLRPERAARIIRRGLERDWARISFPFPLNLGIWGLSLLPACLAMPIARALGYGR